MRVYFDNAATTALDPEVLKEMYKVMENQFGNPSSIHSHGREVRTLIERSRKTIAGLLHTSPAEIFFTSGGTEADNMAIRCGIVDHKLTHAITTKAGAPRGCAYVTGYGKSRYHQIKLCRC
jgi:cysteine desulfurase